MAALRVCGEWLVCSGDRRLLAVHCSQDRDLFELDCALLEKRPKKEEGESENSASAESDQILAIAASTSGTLLALSDDSKRLVLLRRDPMWTILSVRWLARRCTALVFTQAEDRLLAADKSGDVYSLSVKEPTQEPVLQLGHLSMVLDVTVSWDDRFIVTCDRDEKIRVSLSRSPYNIQSFCLGHQQFVSALLTPSASPRTLLSGSGDGTVCVWDMETGHRLQTLDLREHLKPTEETQEQRLTVTRLCSSPDGRYVAVLCERLMEIQLLSLKQVEGGVVLCPHSCLPLSHCPLDFTFDPSSRLWVLLNCAQSPLQVYSHMRGSWEQVDAQSQDLSQVSQAFRTFWDTVDASECNRSRLQHLYVETFDNVSEYMKKKQQRLEQQSHKRNREHSLEQNQPKKSKSHKPESNGS